MDVDVVQDAMVTSSLAEVRIGFDGLPDPVQRGLEQVQQRPHQDSGKVGSGSCNRNLLKSRKSEVLTIRSRTLP